MVAWDQIVIKTVRLMRRKRGFKGIAIIVVNLGTETAAAVTPYGNHIEILLCVKDEVGFMATGTTNQISPIQTSC